MPAAGPRYARWIAQVLLPRAEREFLIGDLEEMYDVRVRRSGRTRAVLHYMRDVIVTVAVRRGRWVHRPGRDSHAKRRRTMGSGLLADVRGALRTLRRERGFSALAVFTLALGIGSTAAVFGMVNQLLLRPLPGATASKDVGYLVLRSAADPEDPNPHGLTTDDFDALRRDASLFGGVATYGRTELTLRYDERRPVAVDASVIYGDYFEVLGVQPAAGRLLDAAATELGSDPLVAVISESLRASLFGAADRVVGRTLMLNGRAVRIIGVAGGGFRGAERGDEFDVWLPYGALVPLLGFDPERLRERRSTMHQDMAVRLRDGIGAVAAVAQVESILDGFRERHAEEAERFEGMRPVIYSGLHTPPMSRARTYASLRVFSGIVLVVLLIACANVANLLLVRNVKRRSALAMHRALGASAGRIARRNIVESLVLAVLGTTVGLVVAWLIALPFEGERLARMPVFESFAIDARVLAFAFAVAASTAVVCGALPAWLAGRFDLGAAMKAAGGRDTGKAAAIRNVLSGAQIALSFALLIGSLLLARTIHNLYAVDTGLRIEGVYALPVTLPRDTDAMRIDALSRDLLASTGDVHGVESVALDLYGPHGSAMMARIGPPDAERGDLTRAQMLPVTPGWFEMFDVRVVSGRTFGLEDWRPGTSPGVVLTASLARRLFGREDVAGRRLAAAPFGSVEPVEVVGVIDDIRMAHTPAEPRDAFFMTFDYAPPFPFATLLVRAASPDAVTASRIREAVERVLPEEPVAEPTLLTDRVDDIHSERRIFSNLLELLSTIAVLLAAVGLYGVLSFAVAGRRREFGVRLALGAPVSGIAGLVARAAAAIVAGGLIVGLFGAYAFSRVLESRLFGITPTEPATYAIAAAALALVGAVACALPAIAAMRVDPLLTLRED